MRSGSGEGKRNRVGAGLRILDVTTYAGQITSADNDRAGVKGRKARRGGVMKPGEGGRFCCRACAAYTVSH